MTHISSTPDPVAVQINTFVSLVDVVNKIPRVCIDLNASTDRQRDALAFAVNTVYHQFQADDYSTALQGLIQRVQRENNPPDTLKTTRFLRELIQHLYESRIVMLINDENSPYNREYLESLRALHVCLTEISLKNSNADQPVSFGGIEEFLLPEWYQQRLYLKESDHEPIK